MADYVDQWSAQGRKNIFGGNRVTMVVDAVRGQALPWAPFTALGRRRSRATTYYCFGRVFPLMIPNMYKIAGEPLPRRLPCLLARTVATHAARDTSAIIPTSTPAVRHGFAMLCETDPAGS